MSAAAITFSELLADNEAGTEKWRAWFAENTAALDVPASIYNSGTVRGVLRHLWAIELRHSERLLGQPVTDYDAISAESLEELFALHTQALANLQKFLGETSDASLNEMIRFQSLLAGELEVSRRKLVAHIFLHSMRHWAQLTTHLREHGYKTEWIKDFLFSDALR